MRDSNSSTDMHNLFHKGVRQPSHFHGQVVCLIPGYSQLMKYAVYIVGGLWQPLKVYKTTYMILYVCLPNIVFNPHVLVWQPIIVTA